VTLIPLSFRARRARATAAVALGLAALATSAGAAPQISQGTWYEGRSTNCTGALSCTLSLTAIPAGKTLIARNLACRLTTPRSGIVTGFSLSGVGTTFVPVGLPQYTSSSTRYYYVNAEIFSTFIAAQIPRVSFSSIPSGNLSLTCSLSGELKP
jgi:hypothetical protein